MSNIMEGTIMEGTSLEEKTKSLNPTALLDWTHFSLR